MKILQNFGTAFPDNINLFGNNKIDNFDNFDNFDTVSINMDTNRFGDGKKDKETSDDDDEETSDDDDDEETSDSDDEITDDDDEEITDNSDDDSDE